MGVLATGAGTEGKVTKEIMFPTRENWRVLHSCVLSPQYPGKHVLRGFVYFYQSHMLYRVKLFSDFFLCWVACIFCKLKFTHLHKYCKPDLFNILTNLITKWQFTACQLDAENDCKRIHRPDCIHAADQRLGAKVCLENKLSLWIQSWSQCFRYCGMASFSLVVHALFPWKT